MTDRPIGRLLLEIKRSYFMTIGMIAAVLTTFSFVPQALKVIKSKDTSGISLMMYSMFVLGVFLWLLHGMNINDIAIIGANLITFCLAVIILAYKIRYK